MADPCFGTGLLFFIVALYYTLRIISTTEASYLWSYLTHLNSTRTLRQRIREFGLSEMDIIQLNLITHGSHNLYSKLIDYFSTHPQCPISMEDITDESHHLKHNISAVVQYDEKRNDFFLNLFSSPALERWLLERNQHPLTRAPMSQYIVLNLS